MTLAGQTPGFTGADLANLVNEAALLAARKGKRVIDQTELEEGIMRVIAGPEKKSRLLTEKERVVTAYHEMGHALVGHFLPDADPVHKISVVRRGQALGYTISMPTEDKFLTTRAQLEDQMAMTLGGRAAEELVFDEITTGAANDLEKVTSTAKQMTMRFGMSDKLGPRVLGHNQGAPFLGRDMHSEPDYSDDLARTIDAEIRRIIEEAHQRARDILVEHRTDLETLSQILLAPRDDRAHRVPGDPRRRARGRGLRRARRQGRRARPLPRHPRRAAHAPPSAPLPTPPPESRCPRGSRRVARDERPPRLAAGALRDGDPQRDPRLAVGRRGGARSRRRRCARLERMADDGAAICDVGAESTRPGADPVGAGEQLRAPRRACCARCARRRRRSPLSIDTSLAPVAAAALDAGAVLVNDVTAGRGRSRPAAAGGRARRRRLPGAHARRRRARCRPTRATATWWREVRDHLAARLAAAVDAGVPEERVLLDPGIGFGKTLEHNLALLAGVPALAGAGAPAAGGRLAQGHVRHAPRPRAWTSGCRPRSPRAWRRWPAGAAVLRVHDVRETVDALRGVDGGGGGGGAMSDERAHVSIRGLEAFGRHGVLRRPSASWASASSSTSTWSCSTPRRRPRRDDLADTVDYAALADGGRGDRERAAGARCWSAWRA